VRGTAAVSSFGQHSYYEVNFINTLVAIPQVIPFSLNRIPGERRMLGVNVYKIETMKKTALFLLMGLGVFPVLFSSCSSAGGTAGNNGSSSYAKATEGTYGVQWTGGNVDQTSND
jgi:hypothetical protein